MIYPAENEENEENEENKKDEMQKGFETFRQLLLEVVESPPLAYENDISYCPWCNENDWKPHKPSCLYQRICEAVKEKDSDEA